jgi:HAE1 family hydrophobic/amphiphilic exporter-1
MLKTFIDRPVLSTVISILIVVLGIIGLFMLPVEQYPDIAPPTVRVSANYPGANADVVMNAVVIPLEEQINGVEGMTYMTSTASNNGSAQITVFFEKGINPDIASVNVQNQVARATPRLPQEVTQIGVTVRKQQSSTILMINFTTDNSEYDQTFLQNYANIHLLPPIKRVKGVGDANVYGARDYSMRIWLKPGVMAAYRLTPQEVVAALQEQNIEAAPGELGQESRQSFQYTLKYTGRLKSVIEYEDIVVRSVDNQVLRLRDVAQVELGALNYNVLSRLDGNESVTIGINQTAGSNAQEIINNIKAELKQAEASFPPGLKIVYVQDANEFLDASIEKVLHTLLEAFLLVFAVVLVFLQNFRSTLIPAIAVPVAIVGTFFFLQLFGFSVNLLTLFALVLAIGIVVDDAIVVVEAVHAQLDAGMTDAREAALKAMKEIAPAIVSITLVMSAVFVPVSFIGGTSGVFYKQFGLTLAVSILISAVNALTLSPALCAIFLRGHHADGKKRKNIFDRFAFMFNTAFQATTEHYSRSLHFLGKRRHRWITVTLILSMTVLLFSLMRIIPSGFVPQEDSGGVMGMVTLAPGASLDRTQEIVLEVTNIAKEIEHVKHVASLIGVNFMSGTGSSYATIQMKMDPWNQRKITTNEVTAILKEKTAHIRDATFIFMGTPTLQGFGLSNGVELQMQDRTGGDIYRFFDVTNRFLDAMRERPEIMMAMTTFNPNFPQKQIEANIPKIKEAGLTLGEVMSTIQAYVGSMYVSDFNLYGKQYRVMVQALPEYREKLDDLNGYFVRTASGEMAPVTEFLTISDMTAPQTLNRFNMYSSMSLTIMPNYVAGYANGDALRAIDEVAGAVLPDNFTYDFSGMTREEVRSGEQTYMILALCLIFVYLLLAALYESYILPLAVICSLPIGLAGVYIFIFGGMSMGTGIVNNIYVQISLIMLIGLLAKNAILIVEYAVQRRRQGMGVVEAAVSGAVARLRPILMTSFALIFGLMPLALASGAGAIGNRSIGISAIGGMLIGTLLGVLVVPSLYIIFQLLQEKFSKSGLVNAAKVVTIGILFTTGVSSCQVLNKYQSPETDTAGLYRTGFDRDDTTTVAAIPWPAYFEDTYLQSLIEESLRENFDLRTAYLRIREAEAGLQVARAAYFPVAALNGQATHARTSVQNGVTDALGYGSTQYRLGVAVQWEVDLWGKLNRQARARYAQYLNSHEYRRLIQTSLVSAVATSYYTLMALDEQLRISNETVRLLDDSHSSMQAMMDAGMLNAAAVEQSNALKLSTRASALNLETAIRKLENALSVMLGRKPGAIERASSGTWTSPDAPLPYGVPVQMLALRPDVRSAELQFRTAFELRNAAQAALYPSLTLSSGTAAGYGAVALTDFFRPENLFANIIGGLTQPLFAGNQLRAQVKITKAQEEEALLNFQKTVLTAAGEVSDILFIYEKAQEKAVVRALQLESLRKSVDYTQELLRAGEATYIEVLTAQQNYLNAQLATVNDNLEKAQAVIDLYRALGGGADAGF